MGASIRDHNYRPGGDRKIEIPKGSGRGYRTLTLQNIEDRVVQKAAVVVLQPLLDPLFDDHSFGFRPRRDRLHALALAEQLAVGGGRWVWLTEDIKDAFNQVPLSRLLDVLKFYLPADDLLKLVGTMVGTPTGRGLRQGGPLSPLMLNVYLHHILDHKWRRSHAETPLIRVADDILVLCRTEDEAKAAYADLKKLLMPAGIPLKGSMEKSINNLSKGGSAHWVGFEIDKGKKRLKVGLTDKSWQQLAEGLVLAHEEADAPLRAVAVIQGWVSQMGPCSPFKHIQYVYPCIQAIANEQDFDEIPGLVKLQTLWKAAYLRWRKLRKAQGKSESASPAFSAASSWVG